MLVTDKTLSVPRPVTDPSDITIGDLQACFSAHGDKPVVFTYGGLPIRPGYHITEVKAGQFSALDCGANPESWTEIFVQLLDGNEEHRHMPAGKFAAIIRKVTDHVALDPAAKLTFEVSDGIRPIGLYRASLPEIHGDTISVALAPRPASCKPRDRWLQEQQSASATCCVPKPRAKLCC